MLPRIIWTKLIGMHAHCTLLIAGLLLVLPVTVTAQNLTVLSGNTFSSVDDFNNYGGYGNYADPISGVSYSYSDQSYTSMHESSNDSLNQKLNAGSVTSTTSGDMVYIGNSSGVTKFSVTYDLGAACEVSAIDTWLLCGEDSQIKKITFSISEDGSTYHHIGTKYPQTPSGEALQCVTQTLGTAQVGRYVKILVEEQTLDYLGGWSYRVSLGEIVILGRPISNLEVLSGNTFSSTADDLNYGFYHNYDTPSSGVTYSYGDQSYTSGYELTNDSGNLKLLGGAVDSTNSADMVYIGNSSGVTHFSVTIDLGRMCEVNRLDAWILCGEESQIKKLTFSISEDGGTYSHLGTQFPAYPSGETVMCISQPIATPQLCRYVKILVEEKTLDYTGDWSYRVSLGEIVVVGTEFETTTDPDEELIPPFGPLSVLSGNQFSSIDDEDVYGDLGHYASPRTGVTYSYQNPIYTNGDELTEDVTHTKLSGGNIASVDAAEMLYLGNSSGVTQIEVLYDLGVECKVESVHTWVYCGAGSQIKKVSSYVSSDGVSYSYVGSQIVPYPSEDSMYQVMQGLSEAVLGRYVKIVIEERSLDYLDNWSYTASIGEIVILGYAPDESGSIALLSDNALRESGTYNSNMNTIQTGATYNWLTQQPFVTDSGLISSDEDDAADGVGGLPDLTDGSDLQTEAAMVCSSATDIQGQYAVVEFDLKGIYDIGEIDVWTLANSTHFMDGYELQISTDKRIYTSLGFTVNKNSRTHNGMVNAMTSGLRGKNARYVKIIMHNANDSSALTVGEIAIWGTLPFDPTLDVNVEPDMVVVNSRLKSFSRIYLDWTDYNHVVNDVDQYRLYIETEDFSTVTGKTPVATYSQSAYQSTAKASTYFGLEPDTTYYIAITPVTSAGAELQNVSPQQLTTPGVIDLSGKVGSIFNMNDPPYGVTSSEDHPSDWLNMLDKADLLQALGGIQKNRYFQWDYPPIDQYNRHGITHFLFYQPGSYSLSDANDWGIWSFWRRNEPDFHYASEPVANVAAQFNTTRMALKAEDSRNLLFAPALGDTDFDSSIGYTWLESLYESDGQNGALVKTYFDVMDVHPYCKYEDDVPTGLMAGVPEGLIQKIAALRTLMNSYGDADKPIVFSELGWSTYIGGGSYLKLVSEVTQRNYLARAYVISAAHDIKQVYWHNFQDDGTDADNIEDNFGIIDWYLHPKPAYYGYYILCRVLSDAVYEEPLPGVSNPHYGYRFWDQKQGLWITALWAADEVTKTATLATSDPGVKVVGIDGSLSYINAIGGEVAIPISGAPIFIHSLEEVGVISIY